MATTARHVTTCTVCKRTVGVIRNWSRWQAGQSAEWRVTRHRTNDRRVTGRQVLCTGAGILVGQAAVRPAVAAPA